MKTLTAVVLTFLFFTTAAQAQVQRRPGAATRAAAVQEPPTLTRLVDQATPILVEARVFSIKNGEVSRVDLDDSARLHSRPLVNEIVVGSRAQEEASMTGDVSAPIAPVTDNHNTTRSNRLSAQVENEDPTGAGRAGVGRTMSSSTAKVFPLPTVRIGSITLSGGTTAEDDWIVEVRSVYVVGGIEVESYEYFKVELEKAMIRLP